MKTKRSDPARPTQTAPLLSRLSTALGIRILLLSVLLGAGVAAAADISNGLLTFTENTSDGGLTVTGFDINATGNVHDLLIPSVLTVGGTPKPVNGIGNSALEPVYWPAKGITGIVTVPSSVVSIGDSAFNGNEISGVILPDTLDYMGPEVFRSCARLESVRIPAGLSDLSYNSFYDCSSLTSVYFPEGLTDIGENAFDSCTSLDALALPKSLTRIHNGAFANCVALKSVMLPGGVTQIGEVAFNACASLESIDIAKSVSVIGAGAFAGCVKLKTVTFYGSIPAMVDHYPYDSPFTNTPEDLKITIICYPGKGFEGYFNDTDRFTIKYLGPDIAVFSLSGTELHDNDKSNFGMIRSGNTSPALTFKISNKGSRPLTGIKIGNSGGNYPDFKIVSRPSTTLAPGATTTFKVKFTPSSKGKLATVLEIKSNDPDEKLIKVKLTGSGF